MDIMPSRLTDKLIKSLKPYAKERKVFDTTVRGLCVRVYPSGRKAFAFFFTNHLRKQRQVSIGDTSTVSLSDARDRARVFAAQVAQDLDPAERKSAARKAETIAELAERFLAHVKEHRKERTHKEYARQLRADVLPIWGSYKVQAIKPADVIALVESIKTRGARIAANRILALLSTMFAYAKDLRLIEHNPALGLRRPTKEVSRKRVLSDEEIRFVWKLLETEAYRSKALALKLVMLSGVRPGEAASAMWQDLDFDKSLWMIPGTLTKNKEDHPVPLISPIRDVFTEARAVASGLHGEDCRIVFPRIGKDARISESTLSRYFHDYIPEDFEPFTPHDLRRTVQTRLQNLGAPHEVLEKIAGHKLAGVAATYQRGDRLSDISKWLQRWHRELERIVEGRSETKVVSLR